MILNGKEFSLKSLEENTILCLLDYYKLHPDTVAIEMNGGILTKSEFSNMLLNETDRLEIIKFVGGG